MMSWKCIATRGFALRGVEAQPRTRAVEAPWRRPSKPTVNRGLAELYAAKPRQLVLLALWEGPRRHGKSRCSTMKEPGNQDLQDYCIDVRSQGVSDGPLRRGLLRAPGAQLRDDTIHTSLCRYPLGHSAGDRGKPFVNRHLWHGLLLRGLPVRFDCQAKRREQPARRWLLRAGGGRPGGLH